MTRLVYITVSNHEEALLIGRELIAGRLAACVNVLPGTTSLYRWEGALREDPEAVVIAKTSERLVPALTERVKALHSAACPCVVSLRIDGGNPDFLQWIAGETDSPGDDRTQ